MIQILGPIHGLHGHVGRVVQLREWRLREGPLRRCLVRRHSFILLVFVVGWKGEPDRSSSHCTFFVPWEGSGFVRTKIPRHPLPAVAISQELFASIPRTS